MRYIILFMLAKDMVTHVESSSCLRKQSREQVEATKSPLEKLNFLNYSLLQCGDTHLTAWKTIDVQ